MNERGYACDEIVDEASRAEREDINKEIEAYRDIAKCEEKKSDTRNKRFPRARMNKRYHHTDGKIYIIDHRDNEECLAIPAED